MQRYEGIDHDRTEELTRNVGASFLPRLALRIGGGLLIAAAYFSLVSAPAVAARSITPPQWFACGTYYAGRISIGPPRVWSSYRRPEQVVWVTQIQRWNGSRWYNYGKQYTTWSTFNYYGQSLTSWSGNPNRYVNSKLNLPVTHRGYYRVASSINGNQGGVTWSGFINRGASCYMR